MPISSSADYIPVMDEVITHWNALGSGIVLPENGEAVSVADFTQLRQDLDITKTSLQSRLNDLENARVALERIRTQAGDRVAEFNRRIRADFPNNALFNLLPAVPNRAAGREPFISAMDDVIDIWSRVNAQPASAVFTAPLWLIGELGVNEFITLRAAVDAAFTERSHAEHNVTETRFQRDAHQDRAHGLIKQYRLKVEALFAVDSVQVATLPQLSPNPGHTPAPVTLTATWDPADARAELSWTPSNDPDLQSYELRSTPGPDYSAADETTVASIPPGGPLTHTTTTGFGQPGYAVSYKLYVRLTTGNEAGSEAVTVTRPG